MRLGREAGLGADEAGGGAGPLGEGDGLREMGELGGEARVSVEDKGGAVKNDFVLAAGEGGENVGEAGFGDTLGGEGDAGLVLAVLEGGAVDGEQELGAGSGEGFGHGGEPPILTDEQAETETAEVHRHGDGAGGEDALFVEHTVVGELVLFAFGDDFAIVEDEGGVVQSGAVAPGGADDDAGAAVSGVFGEVLGGCFAGGDEGGFEDEVLGRVAGDGEFGGDEEVRAHGGGLRTRGADEGEVFVDGADVAVELGDGDAEGGHGCAPSG